MNVDIESEKRKAKIKLLELLLNRTTEKHHYGCPGDLVGHETKCHCGAQTNGGDLVDEVGCELLRLRREQEEET